jgi:Ca2+/Na+ antiporter
MKKDTIKLVTAVSAAIFFIICIANGSILCILPTTNISHLLEIDASIGLMLWVVAMFAIMVSIA